MASSTSGPEHLQAAPIDQQSHIGSGCMILGCRSPCAMICEACRFTMCMNHVPYHCSNSSVQHVPLRFVGVAPQTFEDDSKQPAEFGEPAFESPSEKNSRSTDVPELQFDPMNSLALGTSSLMVTGSNSDFAFEPPNTANFFNGSLNFNGPFPLSISNSAMATDISVPKSTKDIISVPDHHTVKHNKRKNKPVDTNPTSCGCVRVTTPPPFASFDREKKFERVNKRTEAYIHCDSGMLVLPLRTKGDTPYYVACRDLPSNKRCTVEFRFNMSHVNNPKKADPTLVHDVHVGQTHYWATTAPVVTPSEAKSNHKVIGLLLTYCFKGMKMMLRSTHAQRVRMHNREYQRSEDPAFAVEVWVKQDAADSFSCYHSFYVFRQKQKTSSGSAKKKPRLVALPQEEESDDGEEVVVDEKVEASDDETTVAGNEPQLASPASMSTAKSSQNVHQERASSPVCSVNSSTVDMSTRQMDDSSHFTPLPQLLSISSAGPTLPIPTCVSPPTTTESLLQTQFNPVSNVGNLAAANSVFSDQSSVRSGQSLRSMTNDVANLQINDMNRPQLPHELSAASSSPSATPNMANMANLLNLTQQYSQAPPMQHSIPLAQNTNTFAPSFPMSSVESLSQQLAFAQFNQQQLQFQSSRDADPAYRDQTLARPAVSNDYVHLGTFAEKVGPMSFYINRHVLSCVGDVKVLETPQTYRLTPVVIGTWRIPNQVAEFVLVTPQIHPGHTTLVIEYEAEGYSHCQQKLLMKFDNANATFFLPSDVARKIASCSRRGFSGHDAVIRFFVNKWELYRFFFNVNIVSPHTFGLSQSVGGGPSSFNNDQSGRFGGPGGGGGGVGGFDPSGSFGLSFGSYGGSGGFRPGGRQFAPQSSTLFDNIVLIQERMGIVWDGSVPACVLSFTVRSRFGDKPSILPERDQLLSIHLHCPTETGVLKLKPSSTLSTELSIVYVVRPDVQYRFWPNAYQNERTVVVPFRLHLQHKTIVKSTFCIVAADEDLPDVDIKVADLSNCLVDVSSEMSQLSDSEADRCQEIVRQCLAGQFGSPKLCCEHLSNGKYQEALIAAVSSAVVFLSKRIPSHVPVSSEVVELSRMLGVLSEDEGDVIFSVAASNSSPVLVSSIERASSSSGPARIGEAPPTSPSAPQIVVRLEASALVWDSPVHCSLRFRVESTSLTAAELETTLANLVLQFVGEADRTIQMQPSSVTIANNAPNATILFTFSSSEQLAHWPTAYEDERTIMSPLSLKLNSRVIFKGALSFRAETGETYSGAASISDQEASGLRNCMVEISSELCDLSIADGDVVEQILTAHSAGRFGVLQRVSRLLSAGRFSEAIYQGLVDAVAYAARHQASPANTPGLRSLREYIAALGAYHSAISATDAAASSLSSTREGEESPIQSTATSPTNFVNEQLSTQTLLTSRSSSSETPTHTSRLRPTAFVGSSSSGAARPKSQATSAIPPTDMLAMLAAALTQMRPPPASCAQEAKYMPMRRDNVLSFVPAVVRGHNPNTTPSSSSAATTSVTNSKPALPSPSAAAPRAPVTQLSTMSVSAQISSSAPAAARGFPPLPSNMTLADCLRAFNELCAQLYYPHTPGDVRHLIQGYSRLNSVANVVRDHFCRNPSQDSRQLYLEMVEYAGLLNERIKLLTSLAGQR